MRRTVVLLSFLLVACGDDGGGDDAAVPDAGGPTDWPAMTVPASTVPEVGIRREVFSIEGVAPPANPETGAATPAELNRTQIVRYRSDVEPAAPARAVIVAYPGFLGGGASWEHLARHLVRRSVAAGEPVEVWAIDRRSNLLEDLRGADTAEAAGNAEIAHGWYFGGDTIDGEAFPGFRTQAELSYASEWGLATHVEDLRRVIALVPQAQRRARVFLMGHSLGASFAEVYAAWRFADDTRGAEELAGLILIDGLLGAAPITETEYHEGSGGGFLALTGVDAIRASGPRYFELPIFGISVLPLVEVMALRALRAPDAIVTGDRDRDGALRILLQLGSSDVPPMSNRAALGWGMDEGSSAIAFTAVSCGTPTGGPIESYRNALAMADLVRPGSEDATYTWTDAAEGDPGEQTPIDNLAHAFVDGVTNFPEWYFPSRLPLDLAAAAGANLPEDGWHAAAGLRAFDGELIDAPILAIGTDLVTAADYDALAARVAPEVGAGRPNAGATRSDAAGFHALGVDGFTHIDPLTAADWPDNPIPAAVLDLVYDNAEAGTVDLSAL